MVKKCATILAATLVLVFGLRPVPAQQASAPQFSVNAAAEHIPNLARSRLN